MLKVITYTIAFRALTSYYAHLFSSRVYIILQHILYAHLLLHPKIQNLGFVEKIPFSLPKGVVITFKERWHIDWSLFLVHLILERHLKRNSETTYHTKLLYHLLDKWHQEGGWIDALKKLSSIFLLLKSSNYICFQLYKLWFVIYHN